MPKMKMLLCPFDHLTWEIYHFFWKYCVCFASWFIQLTIYIYDKFMQNEFTGQHMFSHSQPSKHNEMIQMIWNDKRNNVWTDKLL